VSKVSASLHFSSGEMVPEVTLFQVPRTGERMTYYEYPGEKPVRGVVTDVEWVSSPLGALAQMVRIHINDKEL
jgi:hypothetical protein